MFRFIELNGIFSYDYGCFIIKVKPHGIMNFNFHLSKHHFYHCRLQTLCAKASNSASAFDCATTNCFSFLQLTRFCPTSIQYPIASMRKHARSASCVGFTIDRLYCGTLLSRKCFEVPESSLYNYKWNYNSECKNRLTTQIR